MGTLPGRPLIIDDRQHSHQFIVIIPFVKCDSCPTWYESEEAVLVDHGDMSMVIDMNDEKLKTLDQIRNFMAGTEGVEFCHQPGKDNRYQ